MNFIFYLLNTTRAIAFYLMVAFPHEIVYMSYIFAHKFVLSCYESICVENGI